MQEGKQEAAILGTDSSSRRLQKFLLFISVVILALFITNAFLYAWDATPLKGFYPIDDAFIFVRYADNILAGYGIAWNPHGEPTYGSTSLGYLLFVTLARATVPLSVEHTVQLLSWSFGLGFILLLSYICRKYSKSWLMHHTCFSLLIILVIFTSQQSYFFHYLSGMETTLAMLSSVLLILTTFRMTHARTTVSALLTACASYWCFLARPDSGIYALLFPTLTLICWDGDRKKKLVLVFSCAFFTLLTIDTIWKTMLFTTPLPLSFYAKKGNFYSGFTGYHKWSSAQQLLRAAIMGFLPLTILLLTARRKDIKRLLPCLLPLTLHTLYLHNVLQITGNFARYYMPGFPFLAVAALLALDRRILDLERYKPRWVHQLAYRSSLALLLLIGVSAMFGERAVSLYRVWKLDPLDQQNIVDYPTSKPSPKRSAPDMGWKKSMVAFSRLLAVLPEGSVAAMSEVGYTGLVAPQVEIIDVAGLNNPYIALNGFSVDYVLSRKPDLVWLPHHDYSVQVHNYYKNPRFVKEYTIFPTAFRYGIAIRKNSPHADLILQRVKKLWSVYYGAKPITSYVSPVSAHPSTKRPNAQ